MKRKISTVLFGLLFLTGFGILAYPAVSDQWNNYRQNQLISSYEEVLSGLPPHSFKKEWKAARKFNQTLKQNNLYGDVFGEKHQELEDTQYWKVLNPAGDGVMGYLSVPKIHLRLAIYHGTGEEILQTGVGHLSGTKLPVGGKGTHCVLAAHRGLPSARLFTDMDQMERGDQFYLHVLDEILAYRVDRILPMVDKDDSQTLAKALQIEEGKDQVTLFTCTPYGVNSHRLLVRGARVPYEGEEEESAADTMLRALRDYYMLYLIMGLCVTLLIIFIMKSWFNRGKGRWKDDEKM